MRILRRANIYVCVYNCMHISEYDVWGHPSRVFRTQEWFHVVSRLHPDPHPHREVDGILQLFLQLYVEGVCLQTTPLSRYDAVWNEYDIYINRHSSEIS